MKQLGNCFLISGLIFIIGLSCSKPEGCIDPNASNYDYDAKKNNNSCIYDMGFWVNSVDHLPVYIYIDGVLKDSLLCGWIGGEPTCGVDTFVYTNIGYIRCTSNIPMPVGKYKVKAVGRDGTVWEKTVTLSENCVNVMISGPN